MNDPWLTIWPEPSRHRAVTQASVELVDDSRMQYRAAFQDSAEKQLGVQLSATVLRMMLKKGADLLGLELVAKVRSPHKGTAARSRPDRKALPRRS